MKNIFKVILIAYGIAWSISTYAQIRLPKLISNGMVLQRDQPVKLWGWAGNGEKILLEFKGKTFKTVTDLHGRWQIPLPPQPAGGPYKMVFKGSGTIELNDVLFGDVWLCAGQSNMELPMERVQDKYPAVMTTENKNIRQFEVPDRYDFLMPDTDLTGGAWLAVNKENLPKFSAVAYFFADELYKKYKVPIGLINTALGGSPAQAWLSENALKQFTDYYNEAQKFKDTALIKQIESGDTKRSREWYKKLNDSDEGLKDNWYSSTLDIAAWDSMHVPGYWADGQLGAHNGSVWFKKEFDLPESMLNKSSKLLLGRIVDADSVYVNNTFVGTTSYLYPPRRYLLPAGLLKKDKNEITIRVINNTGKGGFVSDKPYAIVAGTDSFDLKGIWKYRLGTTMEALPGQTFIRWKPMGLYNGMIAPATSYTIKGAIWYQGESNVSKPDEYYSLMRTLIGDWRSKWGQGNFPFITVQLANFLEAQKQPSESNWAAVRQQQLNTLSVPNTGMAVIIDIGEWNDIHPLNKKEVGKRLSLLAMQLAYDDKNIVASGPIATTATRLGNKIELIFKNAGKGLVAKDHQPLHYFSVAGADGKFVWADAKINGNKVIVWSDVVLNPTKVRYAWADNPEGANLSNAEGLPASPFEMLVK